MSPGGHPLWRGAVRFIAAVAVLVLAGLGWVVWTLGQVFRPPPPSPVQISVGRFPVSSSFIRTAAAHSGQEVPAALQDERLTVEISVPNASTCGATVEAWQGQVRLSPRPQPRDGDFPSRWHVEVPTREVGERLLTVEVRPGQRCPSALPAVLETSYVVLLAAVQGVRLEVVSTGRERARYRLRGRVREPGRYQVRLAFAYRPQHLLPWLRTLALSAGDLDLTFEVPAEEVSRHLAPPGRPRLPLELVEAWLRPEDGGEQRDVRLFPRGP